MEIQTPYKKWFDRMVEYGFVENIDFVVTDIFVHNSKGGKQTQINHHMKIDMAKEISMIQRTEKGKQARQYFLEIERKWNSPEMIMKRAMDYLFMIGQSEKAWNVIFNASIGYVLIQMSPLLLDILKTVGDAI